MAEILTDASGNIIVGAGDGIVVGGEVSSDGATDASYFTFANNTIMAYNPAGGLEVVIPTTIGGEPVLYTADANYGPGVAFREMGLTKVVLPSSMISLADYSLADNPLTEINLNNGLQAIGGFVFSGAGYDFVSSVVIPSTVTSIGMAAFYGRTLTDITIGANVTLAGSTGSFKAMGVYGNTFYTTYTSGGSLAGRYTYAAGAWTKVS